nr:hypothetical protein Iba_chr02aCG9180 [Ipomoea batatas]
MESSFSGLSRHQDSATIKSLRMVDGDVYDSKVFYSRWWMASFCIRVDDGVNRICDKSASGDGVSSQPACHPVLHVVAGGGKRNVCLAWWFAKKPKTPQVTIGDNIGVDVGIGQGKSALAEQEGEQLVAPIKKSMKKKTTTQLSEGRNKRSKSQATLSKVSFMVLFAQSFIPYPFKVLQLPKDKTIDKRLLEPPHILYVAPVNEPQPIALLTQNVPTQFETNRLSAQVLKHQIEEMNRAIDIMIKSRNLDVELLAELTIKMAQQEAEHDEPQADE